MTSIEATTDWAKIFDYREDKLFWRASSDRRPQWNGRYAGKEAGYLHPHGYRQIEHEHRPFQVHRIIWTLVNGPIPEGLEVDHVDRNGLNNAIANLRLADKSLNGANKKCRKDSQTGIKGITRNGNFPGFKARITVRGQKIHLGVYPTAEAAHLAYMRAAEKHFGEFACAG